MVAQQLYIEQIENPKSCAFTGHREPLGSFPKTELKKQIQALIDKGCTVFYCGMAQGFDLLAAKEVIKAKKRNPEVKLIACVPCEEQEKYFPAAEKKAYRALIKKADERVCLAEKYYRGCMQARDRYMADNAEAMIAYLRKTSGGTAYTAGYFGKKYPYKPLILL